MGKINLKPNIKNNDEFYSKLIDAHEGLSEEESIEFNSRLILILSNQVGDPEILAEALEIAKRR
tara:strand:- start:367 stop:558 length:192 start_codon:yes stop_codon:yes gene_type:complete